MGREMLEIALDSALVPWHTEEAVDFRNQSALHAELISGASEYGEDVTLVQVIAKALGRWDEAGAFAVHWGEEPPIFRSPQKTPWGDIPKDFGMAKKGTDIVGLGRVYSPDPQGSRVASVDIETRGERRSLRVFGDRYWERRDGKLIASTPALFSAFDLVWQRSFGGSSINDDGDEVVYPYNISGLGFQVSEEIAEGELLPNFEDPHHPIQKWDDHPCPCNVAPLSEHTPLGFFGRIDELGMPLLRGEKVKLPPNFGNVAHPHFQFASVEPGQQISLTGMTPESPLRIDIPEQVFEIYVSMGKREHRAALGLETILAMPETNYCLLTWRACFAYRFVPHETRRVELLVDSSKGGGK